jgi:hypothetical protein
MKFLLDSNLSHRVAQLLRDGGINAAHVRDNNLQHATDSMIVEFARQHAFVLVSEDTDFGELLARQCTVAPCGARIYDCWSDLRVHGRPAPSRCDLVLAGEPAENRSTAHLVVGQIDHLRRLGFGLGRCELRQRPVWPPLVEMAQVDREDLA